MTAWPLCEIEEAALRTGFHQASFGILLADEKDSILYANPAAQAVWKLSPEAPGRVTDLFSTTGRDPVSGTPYFQAEDMVPHVIPLPKQARGPSYAVYVLPGGRQQMETEQMTEILEGSFDGILVTDGMGNVQFVNSSYERVAAIPRSQLQGHNMRELINPVWMKNSVAFVVMEERRPVSMQQVTQDGRDIVVTGTPVFNGDGSIKRIIINARDISEIYQLREELLKAKSRELQHYQELLLSGDVEAEKVVAVSEKMRRVFTLAQRVGPFDTTVLITGESGAGKEEVARQIHANSMRRDRPMITINCGAIPESLLESELFGYERGAFTGASHNGKTGLLATASGGTVFLDEIGEIPPLFQVKLLRALETKQITRIGGLKPENIDVRFIAATNRDLSAMVCAGTFREDLYYRLNVITITVPPLRQRREDILPLALHFLHLYNRKYDQNKVMTPEVVRRLEEHGWEGNVRELRNTIENMVILGSETQLQVSDLPWITKLCEKDSSGTGTAETDTTDLGLAVEQTERKLLLQAKQSCRSTREMARYLHVDQSTVVRKLHKYGITLQDRRAHEELHV